MTNERLFLFEHDICKRNLLERGWNGLCIRSTTKREDLVSIIAVLLTSQPAEVLGLPVESRIPSIRSAEDFLPLSLINPGRQIDANILKTG
jgi:hypothetical protein